MGLSTFKMAPQPQVHACVCASRLGTRPSAGKKIIQTFNTIFAIFKIWKPPSVLLRQPLKS